MNARSSLWLETHYDNTIAEYMGFLHHPNGHEGVAPIQRSAVNCVDQAVEPDTKLCLKSSLRARQLRHRRSQRRPGFGFVIHVPS